jgi:signal transduction histidine kinase/CheY-like chemotaxis protein
VITQGERRFGTALVVAFGTLVLLLVSALLTGVWLYWRGVVNQSEDRLTATLGGALSTSINKVSFSGKYHSQLLVEEFVADSPDLSYILIQRLDGSVFVESGRLPTDEIRAGPTWERASEAASAPDPIVQTITVGSQPIREVATPLRSGYEQHVTGVIRVGLSRATLAADSREAVYYLALLAGVLSALGVLGVLVLSRRLAKPVHQLAEDFAGILAHAPVGICLYDREGRLVRVSSGLQQLLNLQEPPSELGHVYARFSPEDATELREQDTALFDRGAEPISVERRLPAPGLERLVLTRFPLRAPSGETTHVGAFVVDVTVQRQLEAAVVQSQKMESVGQFAGGVAHDINNILTGILACADMLRLKEGDPDEWLQGILDSCQRAGQLTERLLTFGRKQIMKPQPCDLIQLVDASQTFLRRLLRADLTLDFSHGEQPVPVRVDRGQVEQVIMNLVGNARDAMANGGTISLSVSRETFDEARRVGQLQLPRGDYGVLRVTDQGPGIPAEIRERLFDPFSTTKDVGKGTGLGLSIAYSIVTQHGGAITFSDNAGGGTTFFVYLPVDESDAVADALRSSDIHERDGLLGLRVLVAEDDATVRSFLQEGLAKHGLELTVAADGAEAIARLKETPHGFDLVLCDVIMPRKNGGDVYRALKALECPAKVLFMTGYDDQILQQLLPDDPGLDYLGKPFTMERLLRKIAARFGAVVPASGGGGL